ncbi:hypothetical protein FPQ18DRAFT_37833 [Pyronema domesticum]|uniref:Similar to Fluconazole resistance protein 1 acc. no. O93870 n=1 Tax=Pyronema omphalodes (strain CBS 100304) TaxID=1076935 RepID=U4LPH8_PYROM|nr:hypothetical protein FPQ18DRAFT_37833 [Pyronema domesticum]CCX16535.1 Similar to Fluconazole resistance protein 1; acc. no. O93870 [Pyronema omphalodes CBS 100304]
MLHHHKIAKESSSPISKDAPRKRVARACDRCRLKKGKCDGKDQCAKCSSADVMCIYTDRKPPQHKLISPAVAEALQSENLTLKKSAIILFKQLLEAQSLSLPTIDGVDWTSEKVANGKSGRALNYIISQQARVDNRISNEEIVEYDSDTAMHDSNSGSKGCPDSPGSRQSSPQSAAGELNWGVPYDLPPQRSQPRSRKMSTHSYGHVSGMEVAGLTSLVQGIPTSGAYIDPGLLVPPAVLGSASNHPPTPPTGLDGLEYLPNAQAIWANQQQRFYDMQRFYSDDIPVTRVGMEVPWSQMGEAELYQIFGQGMETKEMVMQIPVSGAEVPMHYRCE